MLPDKKYKGRQVRAIPPMKPNQISLLRLIQAEFGGRIRADRRTYMSIVAATGMPLNFVLETLRSMRSRGIVTSEGRSQLYPEYWVLAKAGLDEREKIGEVG